MNDIIISKAGVLKFLANLNANKAVGPNTIRPIVLKEVRGKIVDIISVLFQKSLTTGNIYCIHNHQFLLGPPTLHHDLDNMFLWEKQWGMEFNPSMCQIIFILPKQNQN
jgi:hypothetical protein